MKLEKVKELSGWQGEAWLVKDVESGHHYAVSRAFTSDRGDETMIFACNSKGEEVNWTNLYAGYGIGHEQAMKEFEAAH